MDDWDPMKEHYKSDANTYDTGPGSKLPREYQTGNQRHVPAGRQSKVRLHVSNIPEDFTKEALEQVFSKHGRVTEAFISPTRHFAGVTFEDQGSAQRALTALSHDPHYDFKISFFVERDKTASDNMSKRNQPVRTREEYDRGSFVNGYSKSRSVVGTSPDQCGYLRHQSKPFADMNSIPTPYKSTTSSSGIPLTPLPPCVNCGVRTIEQCMKCWQYFCTKKCMLMGFQHHTDTCISIAPHTSDKTDNLMHNEVTTTGQPQNVSQKRDEMETFHHNAQDYRRSKATLDQQFDVLTISNSYDNGDSFKQNSHRSENFASKKSSHSAGEDCFDGKSVGAGTRSSSGYQREKENRPMQQRSYDGSRRKSQNDELGGENQGPKLNSRIRNERNEEEGGNDNSKVWQENRTRSDRSYGTQSSRRSDSYRGDGSRNNESRSSYSRGDSSRDETRNDEYRQERSSNRNNESRSSFHKTDTSKGDFRNDENRQKRSSFPENSNDRYGSSAKKTNDDEHFGSRGGRVDDEGTIGFSDPSGSAEKKKSIGGSRGPSDRRSSDDNRNGRGPSDRRSSADNRNNKEQLNREPESAQTYATNRRSYEEGETIEVRLTELNSDPPEFSSINTVEEEALLPKMLADMAQENNLPTVTLRPNTKCLVCRGPDRVRAVISKIDPLLVKYIDSGYVLKDCDENNIRACPEKYCSIKPFAYKVRFTNAEKADLERYMKKNETFKIKIVKKQKELVWEVEMVIPDFNERLKEARQARDTKKNSEKEAQPALVPELTLQPEVPIEVSVTHIENDEKIFYVARSSDLRKLQEELAKHAEACPRLESVEKFITCLTYVEEDQMWYRARIIETNPLKVFFLDYGNADMASKDALKEVPMICNSIAPLAVKVKLAEGKTSDYDIDVNQSQVIRPTSRNTEENLWIVVADDCPEVIITHIVSDTKYFVIEDAEFKYLEKKMSRLPFVRLTSDPKVGSNYLICYDGMNSRAKLTSLSPPTVLFIDFGNEEKVTIDELGELPAEWAKAEPLAYEISILPILPGDRKLPLPLYTKINIKDSDGTNVWKVVKVHEDTET